MSTELDKIAQRRSLWNQIRPSNVTRQIGKLNPIYRKQYAELTAADDFIRGLTGPDGQSIKSLLKELKKNYRSHRWLAVLDRAVLINNIANKIHNNEYIEMLINGMKDYRKEFYFTDQDSSGKQVDMENIEGLANASTKHDLIKQALFGDISRRITDKLLSSKDDRELKRAINIIYNKAETLGVRIIETYKSLDTARAKGKVGDYLYAISSLKKEQEKFSETYKSIYSAIKDYLPKVDKPEVKETESEDLGEDLGEEKLPESVETTVPQQEDMTKGFSEHTFGPQGLEPKINPDVQPEYQDSYEEPHVEYSDVQLDVQPDVQSEYQTFNEIPELDVPKTIQKSKLPNSMFPPLPGKLPPFPNLPPRTRVASEVISEAAKQAIKNGHYGVAIAILTKYSQELEDMGNIKESAKILAIAEEMFNDK